jgi:hypothetical protein
VAVDEIQPEQRDEQDDRCGRDGGVRGKATRQVLETVLVRDPLKRSQTA